MKEYFRSIRILPLKLKSRFTITPESFTQRRAGSRGSCGAGQKRGEAVEAEVKAAPAAPKKSKASIDIMVDD